MNTDTHPRRGTAPPHPQQAHQPSHKASYELPYAALVGGTPVRDVDQEIRGVRAHIRVYGDAAAPRRMVFLHGLRGDHHGLEPIVAHLARQCPDLQVWVPDLPGFGASEPLRDGVHDVAGYAAWTAELLAAVIPGEDAVIPEGDIEKDVVLAGHSFGSIVAAATVAASDAPAVRGLVLVNPIATAALEGPERAADAVTAGVHRLAAALPERGGNGAASSPRCSPGCQRGDGQTRRPGAAALDPRRARPLLLRFRRPARRCWRPSTRPSGPTSPPTPRASARRRCWSRPSATTSRRCPPSACWPGDVPRRPARRRAPGRAPRALRGAGRRGPRRRFAALRPRPTG